MRPPPVADMDRLEPSFRVRLEFALEHVERQGYKPRVFETWRSSERGQWLQRKGTSGNGDRSMHRYGLAADVICEEHAWDCWAHDCDFYVHWGAAAQRFGLTWGGEWRMRDLPHVQAIPVAMQERLRELSDPVEYEGLC